jgi:hypothetical protein
MARIISKIIGVLYVMFGAAGFVLGDETDLYHNLLHLGTGILGVYVGFVGASASARAFCLAFGTGYLALGALGFVLGDASLEYLWNVGLFSVSTPDHIHHLLLGAMLLAGGIVSSAGLRRRRAVRPERGAQAGVSPGRLAEPTLPEIGRRPSARS